MKHTNNTTTQKHLQARIMDFLKYDEKRLGDIFSCDGSEAKKELQYLFDKGDVYLKSDDCENFDPILGCLCVCNLMEN